MFFISRGTVRVFVLSESEDAADAAREERYIISLGAGSFFGEVALLEEVRTCGVSHANEEGVRLRRIAYTIGITARFELVGIVAWWCSSMRCPHPKPETSRSLRDK